MANQEHLDLIKRGVEEINAFAAQNPDVTIDLSGADLASMSLSGLRIQGANLAGVNLAGAGLQRALLNATNLTGANLCGADLSGASFHRADISGADLRDVTFESAYPPRLCIHASSFDGVRWSREQVVSFLGMLNRNADWEIRYEIVPRQS